MDFDTITVMTLWAIALLGLGIPVWLVFYPPRRIRSWPALVRPILAIPATHLAILALFYGCTYPAVRAYAEQNPGELLDGILLVPPDLGWKIAAVIAPILFAFRFAFLECLVPKP